MAGDVSIVIDAVDNASGVLNQIAGKTSALGGEAGKAAPQINALGGGLGNLGKTLLGNLGPIAGFTSLAGAGVLAIKTIKESITLAGEAEMANVKLAQSLLSSGRGAEISAKEIDNFAVALMPIVGIDDENIKNAYAAIAGFQNLPTDKMDEIVTIAADMAAMFGGDLATNATMIAGVLETGLIPRTWRFDAALKAQIQDMIKAGDTGGALTTMLDELNRKYGGQAAAQMDTYAGSVKGLGIAWGEYLEIQGKAITGNVVIKETIEALTNALRRQTSDEELLAKAKLYGIEIDKRVVAGWEGIDAELLYFDELLQKVTTAEWDNADATNEGARALAKMAIGLEDNKEALDSIIPSFGAVAGGWREAGWAALQANAAFDGAITYEEMQKLTKYGVQLGILTQEEANAKMEAYNLTTALNSIPKSTDITLTMWYIQQNKGMALTRPNIPELPPVQTGGGGSYWIPDPNNPGHYMVNPNRAGGGSFHGWGMVGDAPGGGMTPYTEWVYAPHGATVYNQAQMAGKSAPPMAGGGTISPIAPQFVFRDDAQLILQLPQDFSADKISELADLIQRELTR